MTEASPEPEPSFMELLAKGETMLEFVQAQTILTMTSPESGFYLAAMLFVEAHKDDKVTWVLDCLICHSNYEFYTTLSEAVTLRDKPRGLCGKCADIGGGPIIVVS
jgi:hypothetical protein